MPLSEPLLPVWLAVWGLSFVGTWAARRYALRRNLVDAPGERRSHVIATPRGGGIAIVVAVALGAPVAVAYLGMHASAAAWAAWTGMVLVAAAGWLDDHRPVSPWGRLAIHALAAGLFSYGLWWDGTPAWQAMLGFIVPLVLTNVWNFMDGIDGIAASQAAVVATTVVLVDPGLGGAVAALLVAACLGFLPFNFPRARLFMGDVGSGAIGFLLGALVVHAAGVAPAAGLILAGTLAPFMVDAGLTLGRRILRGERWWTPHVQHAYQVAARRWGHPTVTLAFAALAVAGAGLGLGLSRMGVTTIFMSSMLAAWYMSAAILWLATQRSKRDGEGVPPDRKEKT